MSALPSKADKLADVSLSPLCATSGFVHRSKKFARFSVTSSAGAQGWRDFEPERRGSLEVDAR
jgi:hypothetical protein